MKQPAKAKRKNKTYCLRCGADKKEIRKYQIYCSGWGEHPKKHVYK